MRKGIITALLIIVLAFAGFFIFKDNFAGFTGEVINNPVFGGNNSINITLFYGQGCPHCAKEENFLEELEGKYPLSISRYEVYFNQDNREIFEKTMKEHSMEVGGVPTLIIKDKIIVGFSDSISELIEQEIKKCYEEICMAGSENTTQIIGSSSPAEDPRTSEFKNRLTIPAVVSAAFIDSINPCEFAILILLLTTILSTGSKKRAFLAGLAFSVAIYLSYFLMGLGLYSAVKVAGINRIFYIVVSAIAILVGLFNLKDYFFYGKWFVTEVPLSWRPEMKRLIKSITSIPGAFLMGFVISLFLLPCTSGPYIVILGLLAEAATKSYAIMLLLLYNLVFIVPMLAITFIVSFGFASTEKLEIWRIRNLRKFHLIAGIMMLLIGIGMIIAMIFGWI